MQEDLKMGFELDEAMDSGVCLKVVGVGGGGNNATSGFAPAP